MKQAYTKAYTYHFKVNVSAHTLKMELIIPIIMISIPLVARRLICKIRHQCPNTSFTIWLTQLRRRENDEGGRRERWNKAFLCWRCPRPLILRLQGRYQTPEHMHVPLHHERRDQQKQSAKRKRRVEKEVREVAGSRGWWGGSEVRHQKNPSVKSAHFLPLQRPSQAPFILKNKYTVDLGKPVKTCSHIY